MGQTSSQTLAQCTGRGARQAALTPVPPCRATACPPRCCALAHAPRGGQGPGRQSPTGPAAGLWTAARCVPAPPAPAAGPRTAPQGRRPRHPPRRDRPHRCPLRWKPRRSVWPCPGPRPAGCWSAAPATTRSPCHQCPSAWRAPPVQPAHRQRRACPPRASSWRRAAAAHLTAPSPCWVVLGWWSVVARPGRPGALRALAVRWGPTQVGRVVVCGWGGGPQGLLPAWGCFAPRLPGKSHAEWEVRAARTADPAFCGEVGVMDPLAPSVQKPRTGSAHTA